MVLELPGHEVEKDLQDASVDSLLIRMSDARRCVFQRSGGDLDCTTMTRLRKVLIRVTRNPTDSKHISNPGFIRVV